MRNTGNKHTVTKNFFVSSFQRQPSLRTTIKCHCFLTVFNKSTQSIDQHFETLEWPISCVVIVSTALNPFATLVQHLKIKIMWRIWKSKRLEGPNDGMHTVGLLLLLLSVQDMVYMKDLFTSSCCKAICSLERP